MTQLKAFRSIMVRWKTNPLQNNPICELDNQIKIMGLFCMDIGDT